MHLFFYGLRESMKARRGDISGNNDVENDTKSVQITEEFKFFYSQQN